MQCSERTRMHGSYAGSVWFAGDRVLDELAAVEDSWNAPANFTLADDLESLVKSLVVCHMPSAKTYMDATVRLYTRGKKGLKPSDVRSMWQTIWNADNAAPYRALRTLAQHGEHLALANALAGFR